MHDDNHYCSAYDLYLIAKECQHFDAFNEIVKTKSFKIPATSIHQANDRQYGERGAGRTDNLVRGSQETVRHLL